MLTPYLLKKNQELRDALRSFFKSSGYLEVETPILTLEPGAEVHLRYFKTAWQTYSDTCEEIWLRSSPELCMKQMLSSELPRIFQLGPCFRNRGELSRWHHPEFTMLEWYQKDLSFSGLKAQTTELVASCAQLFDGPLPRAKPIEISVEDAFLDQGIALVDGDPDLWRKAKEKGVVSIKHEEDFETAFFKILLEKVEPVLERMGWAILTDYPASQASLADVEQGVAQRFEMYLKGVELCNGYKELTTFESNLRRVKSVQERRQEVGSGPIPLPKNFLEGTSSIPPCSGNALGYDRLFALLMGEDDIDQVVPFRGVPPFRPFSSMQKKFEKSF